MDKQELQSKLSKNEDEINELLSEFKESLLDEEKLVTRTKALQGTQIHYYQADYLKDYLASTGQIAIIPASSKGDLIGLPENVREIVEKALKKAEEKKI